ncbi:MAG: metallopeptidase TldD-related protein, partial [Bryobacteraceae bacterium]
NRGRRMSIRRAMAIAFCVVICAAQERAQESDVLLRAMQDEIRRAPALKLDGFEPPYFVEYSVDDVRGFTVSAMLGGLLTHNTTRLRMPRVQVRLGSYAFDNTNYVFTDIFARAASAGAMPLDDDYATLRRHFWLATDRGYKAAVQTLARKSAALRNITQQEPLEDFARAPATRMVLDVGPPKADEQAWVARTRALSGILARFPAVTSSGADFEFIHSAFYLANSEGAALRLPDHLATLRARASAQAPDGMPVRDAVIFQAIELEQMPSELDMRRAIEQIGANVTALASAPRGEDYSGPVLFEAAAAAQLLAQVLGNNLALVRRPVAEPGRPAQVMSSELEGRQGSRILPEWMDVVDDPTQQTWRGRPLFGHYPVDMEGVVPQPLTLVEKGVLKNFLLTRQPVRGYPMSNGRGRMPGSFGTRAAMFGNLFVRATQSTPPAKLKEMLIEMCQKRDKPYGLLVRKLDFPSTASFDELRRLSMAAGQRGGGRPVSPPILVYKVYRDGREELVRGLRFRGAGVRTLRDIYAAGDDDQAFDYLANNSPLALVGASSFVVAATVVAPSLLFEDLEMERVEEDWPKLPLVPAPSL